MCSARFLKEVFEIVLLKWCFCRGLTISWLQCRIKTLLRPFLPSKLIIPFNCAPNMLKAQQGRSASRPDGPADEYGGVQRAFLRSVFIYSLAHQQGGSYGSLVNSWACLQLRSKSIRPARFRDPPSNQLKAK